MQAEGCGDMEGLCCFQREYAKRPTRASQS
jgi:hypothetical protein